ncbi:hypothetical protein RUM43_003297 [Polyplax serrata]|uniref:Uncharacterized protein n=1 Tax=Polyplax serrata TaxID=468196 RepID=A0AAN8S343_POLSC
MVIAGQVKAKHSRGMAEECVMRTRGTQVNRLLQMLKEVGVRVKGSSSVPTWHQTNIFFSQPESSERKRENSSGKSE